MAQYREEGKLGSGLFCIAASTQFRHIDSPRLITTIRTEISIERHCGHNTSQTQFYHFYNGR